MPKQAIALLVHRDITQVNALIRRLEPDFDLYIHIDKRSGIRGEDIVSGYVWKQFTVHWGGYDMVEATMFLYRKILASSVPYSHVILLSGDSLPVKSNDFITGYLSANKGVSFIENVAADQICLERRKLIWRCGELKTKVTLMGKLLNPFRVIRWVQRKFNITRSIAGFERTGSQWTILCLDHVRHLVEHCKYSVYRFSAVPDESFVQNHFTNHQLPFNANLIYAHWPSKRSLSPHFIDEPTFQTLLASPYLFARKFEAVPVPARYGPVIKTAVEDRPRLYSSMFLNKLGSQSQ